MSSCWNPLPATSHRFAERQPLRPLEEKIVEFERLKEFNENIVESINVGIFAIDLDDRIESWNAQMEAMYALSRAEVLGQALGSVFPSEFIEALEAPQRTGAHHLYNSA